MTALLCAVGFSLVSQAERINGTNFEALPVGTNVVGYADAGLTSGGYWAGEGVDALIATNTFTAVEVQPGEGDPYIEYVPNITPYSGTVGYPAVHYEAQTSNNFLSVNTKGGELVRNVDESKQSIGEKGIYFDSMVQFTATDALDANAGSESDKLILWLRDNGDGTTNLVVNAGYLDDAGHVQSTNYVVTGGVQADKWYRLTIQAIDGLISDGDHGYVGYAIYIDGVLATYSTEVDAFDGTWGYEVGGGFEYLYNTTTHAIFPSLLGYSNSAKTFTSVAFSGVGAVDDIEFTTKAPEFIGPEKVWVAQIGTQGYETLDEALEAAQANDTITLLKDIALTSTVTIDKNLTIDLNGNDIAATDCRAFHVTAGAFALTGSGKVSATASADMRAMATPSFKTSSSVVRVGSNTATTSFTLGENVTVSSDWCYGVSYFGTKKQTVVIDGTVTVTGVQAALSGNGSEQYNKADGGSDVTVNGTVSATQDYAIYNPQTGTTVINGSVTGPGGIEVKAGSVTVNSGAVITATAQEQTHTASNDGTSTAGYAIAAVGSKSYQGEPAIMVTGGTINGVAVVLADSADVENGTITATSNEISKPEGYKWVATETPGTYSLKEIEYATVTIVPVANCTITVKNGNETVASGAQFDKDDAIQLTVTRVAAEGYKLKDCAAEETVSVIGNVTITAVVEEDASNLDPEKGSTSVPVKAESENAAVAVAKSGIKVPAGATVEKAAYAEYFNYSVSGENGEYTVTISGIKETVEASVAESAVERLTNDEATAIEVPAGLYYKITPSTGLPIDGEPQSGLSTGGSVTIGKPGTGTGFYKIELSPTAFPAQSGN